MGQGKAIFLYISPGLFSEELQTKLEGTADKKVTVQRANSFSEKKHECEELICFPKRSLNAKNQYVFQKVI